MGVNPANGAKALPNYNMIPDGHYAKALRLVRQVTDTNGETQPLPKACPFTLDELLSTQLDLAALEGVMYFDAVGA